MPKGEVRTVFETVPEQVKDALCESIVTDPMLDVGDWADRFGFPRKLIMDLARNPRFIMVVARRCQDTLARSTLPKAVAVLNQALSDQDVPWGTRLDAARMVFTTAKPYLDGHLDREKALDELEDMGIDQLEALVRKMENNLRDVTPDSAQNSAGDASDRALFALNS